MEKEVSRKNISFFGIPLIISSRFSEELAAQLSDWGVDAYPFKSTQGSIFAEVLRLEELSKVTSGKFLNAETAELPLKVAYEPTGRIVIVKHDYDDIQLVALTVARQVLNLTAILSESHIFHASGAVDPSGNAVLFCGHSGSGRGRNYGLRGSI